MRRKSNLVCAAVQQLVAMGIEVISIDMQTEPALIDINDSHQVYRLRGDSVGHYSDGHRKFVKKSALLAGCTIAWSEQR